VAVTVVTVSACSGPSRARVTGKVTVKGAPLKGKVVLTFLGPDHEPRSTQTDDTGSYALGDLPVGPARVTVVPIPEGGPASRGHGGRTAPGKGAPRREAAPKSEVPAAYMDASQPRLSFDLQPGDNPIAIDLK
jgi:hypothetical protein